ncbi:helix-turn-helix domain-containing protein [Anaerocolumna sedimenticola]|uniref:Helix-turn-helix domain-containing protein n=1 Tax=Anaerocolumna sedimenticola TaxID=2696063 RepID=A0A6P1TRC5_9FIRM|nr:helix-turn-helix domain-containing protein [Anaerocolumna sedimenticola]QHQ61988.1 helix-turn-helix domain-containing protein [Anaerocolumna sedimenticola]
MINNSIKNVALAIDYIEAHLTEKIDLDIIANAIHYSKYHLHRMFTNTIGLTIHEYVQRRKLTEAAKLLVFSNKPILDIALIAGYESQQAFTNIFTAMYKQPPSKYRDNEKFYPLQAKFEFEGGYDMLDNEENIQWDIDYASEEDISCWMVLVRLVIDGFPHLHEDEYIQVLKQRIKTKQALILKDNEIAIGAMLFSYKTGSIDFLGTHPLYRKKGIPQAFLDKVMRELLKGMKISITTYREGDKADTGHRKAIMDLGFAEAELLVEFDYPTQRFVLPKEKVNEYTTET